MRNFITVKPEKDRLLNILAEIEKGEIKIPKFQRSLVWSDTQMKDLFDSIRKGYPIGSLLLWVPSEGFDDYKYFGPYIVNESQSRIVKFILDGCQRLTTLFGVLSNPEKFQTSINGPNPKKFQLYYNLQNEEFTYLKTKANQIYLMPLYKAIDTFEYLDFIKKIQEEEKLSNIEKDRLINNAKNISKVLLDYEIPFTVINGGDINSAVEIFSRVNSKGTEISEDWMLSALLYNKDKDFLLSSRITEFLSEMRKYNFENLKRDTVIDCIASAIDDNKVYFDIKIEDLARTDKEEFEHITELTLNNIEKAISFLYYHVYVIDYKFLPYPSQLVFINCFFRYNPNPSPEQIETLKKWFWVTSYSNYFTIYTLSQQRKAYQIFKDFAKNGSGNGVWVDDKYFNLDDYDFTAQPYPKKLDFGSVRSKTLQLFFLKTFCRDNPINEMGEIVKEYFITYQKDRTPGNVILRLVSDIENNPNTDNLETLINSENDLHNIFIHENFRAVYLSNKEIFPTFRNSYIIGQEKSFVNSLNIEYQGEEYIHFD